MSATLLILADEAENKAIFMENNLNQNQANQSETNNNPGQEQEYRAAASKFINETSLDKMHEIAEAARIKKMMEPPKWVMPEDL
ncbi:hypothetical protein [Oscillatoria salina]|uniref:hypothetical protein n=1 Tax=Oscillatoria salina TaxID=331517 RepID=UPI001CCD69C8|nr:hypothetical protein [Oscillatoria salina]MBZ8178956.1 hypothetical protein [Oscillatoria salina IIICB1]